MQNTSLHLNDSLPLTCSRAGTCCHGNLVRLNPWELRSLARAKGLSLADFRNTYTLAGGTILNFNGKPNHTGKSACGLYEAGKGCSVHPSRPLACRLFPLGRQIQHGTASYLHEGAEFPCLKECAEVLKLPELTVEEYLIGQETPEFELAQDAYLEIMQNLADVSFELLLETGLAESGDTETLASWKELGRMGIGELVTEIPADWLDVLMIPDPEESQHDRVDFIQRHQELLNEKEQKLLNSISTMDSIRESAKLMMALALFLAHTIGADVKELSEHWIGVAKSHGAAG